MELFRGYVPTRNKQCLEKFKGVEKLKTRSEVQDLDEYAGILEQEVFSPCGGVHSALQF